MVGGKLKVVCLINMAIQDHNLNLTEQEYRDLELPSYSMLASIDKQGVDVVGGVKQNFNLKFGSLVDMMCFEPHRVDEVFYQASAVKAPTLNVKKICDLILYDIYNSQDSGSILESSGVLNRKRGKIYKDLKKYTKEIVDASLSLGVYKSYNDQKIIDTVIKAGSTYFKDKVVSNDKILIKPEMWQHASHTAATLISHKYTGKYFAHDVPGIEIIYQYKFVTMINGYECKGMLDVLVVNHNAKLIFPVDLKTGESPCKDFPILYTAHRYYIQGALYKEGIKSVIAEDEDLKDYEVKPFEFIYISKLNPNKPSKFTVDDNMHSACLKGFTDRYGYKYKGVYDLFDDYYFSKNNNNSEYTEEEIMNKGVTNMDLKMITGNENRI